MRRTTARDDELIGAELVSAEDDLLLVSRKAQSIRFTATDDALRPMGRATSGVKGMSFREGDELLSMNVVRPGTFVFTATDGGYAKRTNVDEYRVQGRGGLGIKAAKIVEDRGSLVGALVVEETDEILAITLGGGVIRTRVNEVRETGRDTMGVQLINLGKRDAVVGIARNAEAGREAEEVDGTDEAEGATVEADAASAVEGTAEGTDAFGRGARGVEREWSHGRRVGRFRSRCGRCPWPCHGLPRGHCDGHSGTSAAVRGVRDRAVARRAGARGRARRGPTTRRRRTSPQRAVRRAAAPGRCAGRRRAQAMRRPRTGARTTPRTRKARLRVAKADPWSVMKVSFLLSIALGICTVVAAAVLWMVMDAMGVFSTVGGTISEATGSNEPTASTCSRSCRCRASCMFTSVIAVIDVVLATALATLGAFIYNLSAGFVGGVELTLAEDE